MKTLKRTLAIVLTLIMAITMFAGVVSAEDAVAEEVVDTSYTWTPYKGVSVYASTKTTETNTENVETATAPAKSSKYEDLGTVDNGDGTVTTSILFTTVTVSDNGDGTTAVTTKKETETTVAENPAYINDEFSYKIFSNRTNALGFVDCTDFKAKQVYSDSKEAGYLSATNKTWNNESKASPVMPEDDNGRYHYATDKGGSFYTFAQKTTTKADSVMYVSRANNDMWLEFTAPSEGVYSASGLLSEHYIAGGGKDDQVDYKFVKVDLNGNNIALTAYMDVADRTATAAEKKLAAVKVKLEKGEKLVITTHQLTAGGVRKVFLDGYAVTKLDYSEADDNSTVTTNYSYKNYNYEKIYGDSFATSLPKNYENVWEVNAARFCIDNTINANKNLVLKDTVELDTYSNGTLSTAKSAWCDYSVPIAPNIIYDSVNDILKTGVATYRDSEGNMYSYGLQLIFTVPEDGNAVLTAPEYFLGNNMTVRYGVKKTDGEDVEYFAPIAASSGKKQMWYQFNATKKVTFDISDLKAGDKIYVEITTDNNTANNSGRYASLNSLNVALTTENTPADVTGDFKADATDATFMRKHLLRKLTGKAADLDITGNGTVDIRDYVRLKKTILGVA